MMTAEIELANTDFLELFFFLFGIAMNVAGLWRTRCIIQYVWQLG